MLFFKLLRVKHYIKNFLCFLPLFLSVKFIEVKNIYSAIFAFLAFCMASSIVYIFNDIMDRKKDKADLFKCKRPIASGKISIKSATRIMVLLFMCMCVFDFYAAINSNSPIVMLIYLNVYIIINFFYSIQLKKIPLIDVIILALGFIIRVLYGGVSINSEISDWVYLTILSMAFFFSFGKRRNELKRWEGKNGRDVLKQYPLEFLSHSVYVSLTLFIVFYSLCVTDPNITLAEKGVDLRWTIIFVIYLCLQYALILEVEENGDPVEVFFQNRYLVCIACFLLLGIVGQIMILIY